MGLKSGSSVTFEEGVLSTKMDELAGAGRLIFEFFFSTSNAFCEKCSRMCQNFVAYRFSNCETFKMITSAFVFTVVTVLHIYPPIVTKRLKRYNELA